jgi:hypothetical protein
MTGALVLGAAGAAYSAHEQSSAAESASRAQQAAADEQIQFQREALAETRELLSPYVEAGDEALLQQLDLLGIGEGGEEAQQRAISGIETSPLFQAQVRQGEEAMLQQAAATGGLRGGNIQGALAQYRPAMLQREIESQYAKLGGLAGLGQASAAGVGAAGQQAAGQMGQAAGQIGAAQAGQALAQGQAATNLVGGITGGLQQYALMNQLGLLGGTGGVGTAAPAALSGATLSTFSDSRLKTNITKTGIQNGINTYEWDWVDGSGHDSGVIAQEVLSIRPDCIGYRDGYLTVNYGRLFGV